MPFVIRRKVDELAFEGQFELTSVLLLQYFVFVCIQCWWSGSFRGVLMRSEMD